MTVKTLMLRKTSQEKAEFLFRQNGDHVLPITQIKYKDRSIYDDYIGSPGFLASLTQVQLYALFQLEFKNTLFLDALFLMDKRRLVCFFDKPGQNYCNPLYYAVIHHNVKFFDYLFREETILKIGSETVTSFLKDRFYFLGNVVLFKEEPSYPSIFDYSVRRKFYSLFHLLLQPEVVKHIDVLGFYEQMENQICLLEMKDDERSKLVKGFFSEQMLNRYGVQRIVDLFLKSSGMIQELFRVDNNSQFLGINFLMEPGVLDLVGGDRIQNLFFNFDDVNYHDFMVTSVMDPLSGWGAFFLNPETISKMRPSFYESVLDKISQYSHYVDDAVAKKMFVFLVDNLLNDRVISELGNDLVFNFFKDFRFSDRLNSEESLDGYAYFYSALLDKKIMELFGTEKAELLFSLVDMDNKLLFPTTRPTGFPGSCLIS